MPKEFKAFINDDITVTVSITEEAFNTKKITEEDFTMYLGKVFKIFYDHILDPEKATGIKVSHIKNETTIPYLFFRESE